MTNPRPGDFALVALAALPAPVTKALTRSRKPTIALIFPGLGLGVTVARASRITDGMLAAAADTVAALSDATAVGASLLPSDELRMVSAAVGVAVAEAADSEGLAQADLHNPVQQIHEAMWRPAYPKIELA